MQRQKWKHEQCSYCGNKNTQFICWRCHESDIEQLREEIEARDNRIETLEFKFNELVSYLQKADWAYRRISLPFLLKILNLLMINEDYLNPHPAKGRYLILEAITELANNLSLTFFTAYKQHLPGRVKKGWWHTLQKLKKDLEYGGANRGKTN